MVSFLKRKNKKHSGLGPLANSIQDVNFFKLLTGSEDKSLDGYLNEMVPRRSGMKANPLTKSYNITPAPLIGGQLPIYPDL